MEKALDALGSHWRRGGVERERENFCPRKKTRSLPTLIITPWASKHPGGRGGADVAVEKKLCSWRLEEMDKTCILDFGQKVFDGGLGKQMDFPFHEA